MARPPRTSELEFGHSLVAGGWSQPATPLYPYGVFLAKPKPDMLTYNDLRLRLFNKFGFSGGIY